MEDAFMYPKSGMQIPHIDHHQHPPHLSDGLYLVAQLIEPQVNNTHDPFLQSHSHEGPNTSSPPEFGSVKVIVRCRPMNQSELRKRDKRVVRMDPHQPNALDVVSHGSGGKEMCCGIETLLQSTLEGYHATVFAYGPTGSGKTYTMSGVEELLGSNSRHDAQEATDGIIPRAMQYLFAATQNAPPGLKYTIKASYCEIYNEQVYDLLNAGSEALTVRWNDSKGFYVQDLLVVQCDSLDDISAVIEEGHKNRRVGSHEMNKDSSRSHSIMTTYIDHESVDPEDGHPLRKYGKMSFIDLAGSERLKDTKSMNTEETSNINKSLFTLGKVISALASGSKTSGNNFVPYRDSKLTKLLMDSLGGNSLTLMIACVSPASSYLDDTLSTLNYATRAKKIQNKPIVQMDPQEQLLMNLRNEIKLLRAENHFLKQQLGSSNILTNPAAVHPSSIAMDHRILDNKQFQLSPSPPGASRAPHHLPPFPVPPPGMETGLSSDFPKSPLIAQRTLRQHSPSAQAPASNNSELESVLEEYEHQLTDLKEETRRLRSNATVAEQSYHHVMLENDELRERLERQNTSSNPHEVEELKSTIHTLENDRHNCIERIKYLEALVEQTSNVEGSPQEVLNLRSTNEQLQLRVEHLQKREKDLMKAMARKNRMRETQD